MFRNRVWGVVAAAVTLSVMACTPAPSGSASVFVSAKPNKIDNAGEESTITVTATDEAGKPGSGSVKVISTAGSLTTAVTLPLDVAGTASTSFSCELTADSNCSGVVRVTAEWTAPKSGLISGTSNVTVTGPTAIDSGTDAGTDGGSTIIGGDAGYYTVTMSSPKAALIVGTGDSTAIGATVTVTDGGVPAPNVAVALETNIGSFANTAGTLTTSATTNDAGVVGVTLYAADADGGLATVRASTISGVGTVGIYMLNVASIVPDTTNPTVKKTLGTLAGGRDTTTPVVFIVRDAASQPVGNVDVSFAVGAGSPAGVTVTPTARSNAQGLAISNLQSGNDVGTVAVEATVVSTTLKAVFSITITGGKPSFRGFVFDCSRKNLGALTNPGPMPPTRPLTMTCSAQLADRFSNLVGLPTPVSFFAERGTIEASVTSSSTGTATANYSAQSNFLPNNVAPLTSPVEPTNGANNPRDQIINIIAVVSGEEEFSDTNNNGKWEPGEWFLDMAEPFVDENDNGVWDPGEQKLDTQRLNCATGVRESANGQWDGPNGCWDDNTQIWAPTLITWSDGFALPILLNPPPPWTVAPNDTKVIDFIWSDEYLNPVDKTNANVSATIVGTRGSASVNAPSIGVAEILGHGVAFEKVEATETAANSGVFNVAGPCVFTKPPPANPLTRCIFRSRFTSFGLGNTGQLILTGPGPQAALADGGVAPPVQVQVRIQGQNAYFTPTQQSFTAFFQ